MNYNDLDAYVILFCGKTGDGKWTAINAFFNIIKGIELEDNYRFILVTEPKKAQGQAESQTDGVHLYYLKDKDNKPVKQILKVMEIPVVKNLMKWIMIHLDMFL